MAKSSFRRLLGIRRRRPSPTVNAAHREVRRREAREARIYDKDGRRKPGTIR